MKNKDSKHYLLLTLVVLFSIYGFNAFQAARERAWRMPTCSELKQISVPPRLSQSACP